MTEKILVDANLWINAFDKKQPAAVQELLELIRDKNAILVLTALIRYEVLRGIRWESRGDYSELKAALDQFETLDINRQISDLATNLYRYDVAHETNESRNFEKRKFDMFHFATAKHYQLKWRSRDRDMGKLEDLHQRYKKSL